MKPQCFSNGGYEYSCRATCETTRGRQTNLEEVSFATEAAKGGEGGEGKGEGRRLIGGRGEGQWAKPIN